MAREDDIFEVYPNGDLLWRMCVTGLENARLKLAELGKQSDIRSSRRTLLRKKSLHK